jgi:hypothetical protein
VQSTLNDADVAASKNRDRSRIYQFAHAGRRTRVHAPAPRRSDAGARRTRSADGGACGGLSARHQGRAARARVMLMVLYVALALYMLVDPATANLPALHAAGEWRLPPIDWSAGGVVGPTDQYAVRAFDAVYWQPEKKWYLYCDLVLYSNPECPSSFGSEIGVFSADTLDTTWTYHGIAVPKNHSQADAGGLATPTAIVHDGKVFIYFAYEGLPVGAGLRGIGGATATHPLGPFSRTPPAAVAPAGWHRPAGPGGILDDPEVIFWGGRFHLFHSRKHLQAGDFNCSRTPATPAMSPFWSKCVEWRTSTDGITWVRRGVLNAEEMSETMSARVYPNDELVLMTDGKGMVAFTTNASGLMAADASGLGPWTPGVAVNSYAGLNGSFVNVALRVLPVNAEKPTHVALGWRDQQSPDSSKAGTCRGGMTFAVFPLEE